MKSCFYYSTSSWQAINPVSGQCICAPSSGSYPVTIFMNSRPYLQSIVLKNKNEIDSAAYPFSIPAVGHIEDIQFHSDVTFFVGENGSGKSTILEAIALALGFNEEGGTKNVNLNTASSSSSLHQYLRLIKSYKKPADSYFLRAESFYNVASYMDQVGYLQEYGGKSLHQGSHGEAFLACLLNKFRGNGIIYSRRTRIRPLSGPYSYRALRHRSISQARVTVYYCNPLPHLARLSQRTNSRIFRARYSPDPV